MKKIKARPELELKVGRLALAERKNRGMIKLLARVMCVTPQTIHRWKRMAMAEKVPKRGRPRMSAEVRAEVKRQVKLEMARQGNPGWRAISDALPTASVRLIQEFVAEIKVLNERESRKRIERRRVSVKVLAREAIWGIDGTQIGTRAEGASDAQVVKDFGSLAFRSARVGPPAKTKDAIKTLEAAGEPPLVISSDNGSPYCSEEAEAWMEKHKIVHLKSLPRTPQHNGAMEAGIKELKALCSTPDTLWSAASLLNNNRHRATCGYKTSAVLDAELPVAYHLVSREVFYEKCMAGLSEARMRPMNWRDRRMSEREVIYAALEEFGLIKRTGGRA